jgi:uncharacterized protein YbjT (DUF2867 family)
MILITTPTGDIGGQALALLRSGTTTEPLRVVVRDPARLPDGAADEVDVVVGSHGDPEVLGRALDGVDAVLWIVPPDPAAASLHDAFTGFTEPAARAFAEHGVTHVVGVSALGRGTAHEDDAGLVTASLRMDDLLAGSGVAYRALANPSFMDNVLRQADLIRDAGVYADTVRPDRRAPTAATRDIAAAAVRLLVDRSWTGTGEVPVLGPEDLSPADLVTTMSDVLGRPVRYEHQTFDALAERMRGFGAGEAFVDGMVAMMRAKDAGLDAGVERTGETASPTTFRVWCEEVLLPAVRGGATV